MYRKHNDLSRLVCITPLLLLETVYLGPGSTRLMLRPKKVGGNGHVWHMFYHAKKQIVFTRVVYLNCVCMFVCSLHHSFTFILFFFVLLLFNCLNLCRYRP